MFEFTLVDHLRLTFGHVVYQHKAHSRIAHQRARWGRAIRAADALLIALAALGSLAAATGKGPAYAIAAALLAGLALIVLLVQLGFDFDRSARVHASCAAELWQMRERYRALMSDLCDGAIDIDTARRRRDVLIEDLHGIYKTAPAEDAQAYQTARRAVATSEDTELEDEEINRFLPKSLRKPGTSAAA